jgi:hypothetical protein
MKGSKSILLFVALMALFAAIGTRVVFACVSCNVTANITAPADQATVRGEAVVESGTASDGGSGHGLNYLVDCLAQSGKSPIVGNYYWTGGPHSGNWSKNDFDTRPYNNGSASFKACAFCLTQPHTNSSGSHTHTVTIDNHYLLNVVRNTTLTFKYYKTAGGWEALSSSYECLTTGSGDVDGPNHTGTDHTYCGDGDTPPYTKSDPNNEFSYPTIGDYWNSWTQEADGSYGRKVWDVDGNKYYTVNKDGTGNIVGHWYIRLPNRTAPCGCYRDGLQIHGGMATTNMSDALADNQTLNNTHGCIRMHNADLTDLITNYIGVYKPRVNNDHIHISVPE